MRNVASLALFAGFLMASSTVDADYYSLSPLQSASFQQALDIEGINSTGLIAAGGRDAAGNNELVLIAATGVSTFSTGNASFFDPQAINSLGNVAGCFYVGAPTDGMLDITATLYENGQLTYLTNPDPVSGFYTYANGINDAGVVVGNVWSDDGQHAIRWDDGQPTYLQSNGAISSANGITNGGLIYGVIQTPTAYWAPALWQNGQPQILPMPDPNATIAGVIKANDNGQALVDYALPADSENIHFAFYDNGEITILDGGADFQAFDLNEAGIVVGTEDGYAFSWQDGQFQNLNDLIMPDSGWVLTSAEAINDSGDIAGTGYYDGALSAFLLTPTGTLSVPEPAAIPLAAAFCLLAARRRTKASS